MTEFEVDEEYITENTPIEAMTNDELLKKRDYIYGTYRNKNYLNQIDQEIKDRGLGSPSWQQDDAEYEKQFEVNTSYDQDKEIGSIPSAYFAHSQPMNAKNGGDEKFESRDQQKWYYATDQTYLDDEPHENRKVEEKLNKDGTGVRKATRGLNPKKTPAKVLEFVYVSKSECEICRQYDGQIFATDSPNRPIIPRLESQGKKGTRPYTHPNCKCKWVRPFSKTGLKNFGQTRGGEAEAYELKQKTIDMARKTIVDFDKLSKRDQYVAIAHMFKERLSSPESFDPTSLPIASMIKMTYDAIEPTLALQLAKMSHRDSNEVRDLIDDMVGESLSSERKHSIVLEHNLDFTFENLLKLTVTALEHDVWDENTNTLVDPTLIEDKKESDEGEFGFTDPEWDSFPKEVQDQLTTKVFKKEGLDDEEQYMPDVYNIDPYPHRHEFIDNVCVICDYVLKASEWNDRSWYKKPPVCPNCNSIDVEQMWWDDHKIPDNDEEFGYRSLESPYIKCNDCGEEFIEGFESKATEDHSKPYTDKFGKRHVSWTCPKCGEEFGIAGHSGEGERFEHIMSHESKASESNFVYDYEQSWKNATLKQERLHLLLEADKTIDNNLISELIEKNWEDLPYEWQQKIKNAGVIPMYESKATEGGRGSGRKGHQKWMLGAEADPEECPNCMIFTEKKNGNCQICGNSY